MDGALLCGEGGLAQGLADGGMAVYRVHQLVYRGLEPYGQRGLRMISVARSARMWTPSISPYFAPAITFTMPFTAPTTRLLPFALVGKRPTLTSIPRATQSSSVSPTQANSGPM